MDATTANSEKSKVQTAKEEAVAQVRSVAETAGEQTRNVASDIGEELKAQLGEQKGRLASSVREIGDELEQAAQGSSGTVAGLAGQAAHTTRDVSRWIETHEPRDVLAEIEGFARQRPVLFVAGAAALGVLVGRVTRNAVAVARDTSSGQTVDLRQATAEPGGTSLHPVPHLTGEPVDEAILGASAGPLQQRGMAADEPIVPGDVLPEAGPAIGQGRQAGGPA